MNPQTFARAVPLPFMLATVLATPGTAPLPVAAQSASSIVVPNAWNDRDLLDAIRRGDTSALKSALASKVDPNTKDETGATALMYAAAYASAADVQLLLEAGADVNAANGFGSTALMWAAGDPAKVRLLLDRGAAPNARAVDRTTALLVAARLESGESMRLLIERGANPTLTASDTVNLLQVAYTAESPDVRRVLSESGVALKDPHEIRYSLLPNLFDPPCSGGSSMPERIQISRWRGRSSRRLRLQHRAARSKRCACSSHAERMRAQADPAAGRPS
jgi:uncharacterized protein